MYFNAIIIVLMGTFKLNQNIGKEVKWMFLRGCLITMTKLFQYDFMAGLMG